MAALVVDKSESRAVGRPAEIFDAPRIGEQLVADLDLPPGGDFEQLRPRVSDPVAGLEIVERPQFGLHLIGGRRLDDVHRVFLGRLGAHRDQFLRVRRPPDFAQVVPVLRAPVRAEREFLASFLGPQAEVVVLQQDEPLSVGRFRAPATAPLAASLPRTQVLLRPGRAADFDDRPGILLGRLKDAECRVGLARDQPDMPGERVLAVLIPRSDRGIAAPLAIQIEPVHDDFRRRLVHKRDAGFRTGATGRPRPSPRRQRVLGRLRRVCFLQFVITQVQAPSLVAAAQDDRTGIVLEDQSIHRQLVRGHRPAQRLAERLGHPRVIECRLPGALSRVNQHELASPVRQVIAIPELRLVGEPMRDDPLAIDARFTRRSRVGDGEYEQHGVKSESRQGCDDGAQGGNDVHGLDLGLHDSRGETGKRMNENAE